MALRKPFSVDPRSGTSLTQLADDQSDQVSYLEAVGVAGVFWQPQNSREQKFLEWLERRTEKDREAMREALREAAQKNFISDRVADLEQTAKYLARLLAFVAANQRRIADIWLADAKARAARNTRIIERDNAQREKAVLIERGVVRGRR